MDEPAVVFVVHTWFPNHQSLVDELSGLLRYPVRYFVLSSQDANRAWGGPGTVRVPATVIPGISMRLGRLQVNFNMNVTRFLAGIRPAAVVTKGWHEPAYYVAQRFARAHGAPLITWFCGRDRQFPASLPGLFLRKASNFFFRRVVRQSRYVFVYGSRPREDALELGAPDDRIVIVRHTIDESHFDYARQALGAEERLQTRRSVGLGGQGPLFLCISQLVPRKGIPDLLHSFARVHDRRSGAQLLLIGKGPLEPVVRKYVAQYPGSFAWLPSVPYAEIPRYYALADYFLLTTHFDAWATVINEAHCAKLPVISCDAAHAVDDLVTHGQTGLVYRAGDIAGLVEAMEYALDHPAEMKQMAERGYQFIQSTWNLRESARIWAQYLEIAIQEGNRWRMALSLAKHI
jgi:glycosyltransferase involved in cell wall biosynthesis